MSTSEKNKIGASIPKEHVAAISWLICDHLCTIVLVGLPETQNVESYLIRQMGVYVPVFDDIMKNAWLTTIIHRFTVGLYYYITKHDRIEIVVEEELIQYVEFVTFESTNRIQTGRKHRDERVPIYDFSTDHLMSHYLLERLLQDIDQDHSRRLTFLQMAEYYKLFKIILENNLLSIGTDQVNKIEKIMRWLSTQVGKESLVITEERNEKYIKEDLTARIQRQKCDIPLARGLSMKEKNREPGKITVEELGIVGLSVIHNSDYILTVADMYYANIFEYKGTTQIYENGNSGKRISGDRIYFPSLNSTSAFVVEEGTLTTTLFFLLGLFYNPQETDRVQKHPLFSLKNLVNFYDKTKEILPIIRNMDDDALKQEELSIRNNASYSGMVDNKNKGIVVKINVLATISIEAKELMGKNKSIHGIMENIHLVKISPETFGISVSKANPELVKNYLDGRNIKSKGEDVASLAVTFYEKEKGENQIRADLISLKMSNRNVPP